MDNLVKGAAGQAVQNANLMFGLPETTGLDRAGGAPAMSAAPTGPGPANDDSLANQRTLVVAALRYIQRFSGTRAVIKYGGAAMVDPELKRSFAQDVVLLRAAGLLPVVVHGGGPEINRTLERLGQKSEFVDGQRVTGPEEIKVVEMVLTGKVNTEIVGPDQRPRRRGHGAVGQGRPAAAGAQAGAPPGQARPGPGGRHRGGQPRRARHDASTRATSPSSRRWARAPTAPPTTSTPTWPPPRSRWR